MKNPLRITDLFALITMNIIMVMLIFMDVRLNPTQFIFNLILIGLIFRSTTSGKGKLIIAFWKNIFYKRDWKTGWLVIREALILKNGLILLGLSIIFNNTQTIAIVDFLTLGGSHNLLDRLATGQTITTLFTIICIVYIGIIQKTAQRLGYGDSGAY